MIHMSNLEKSVAEFLIVFNSQDVQIEYTIEHENNNKELNVLDVCLFKIILDSPIRHIH